MKKANFFWFFVSILVLVILFALAIVGYWVEYGKIGDKRNLKKKLVEAIDEDHPDIIPIESRKYKWALFLASFSISRNFHEIFTRNYRSIRDRRFDVFDGLRVHMISWIILGHTYVIGHEFSLTN